MFDPAPQHVTVEVEDPHVQALRRAKALIADQENWCQGTYSSYSSVGGLSYCALGAVLKASDRHIFDDETPGFHAIESVAMGVAPVIVRNDSGMARDPVVIINDYGTHDDVMALFDLAIEYAERNAR